MARLDKLYTDTRRVSRQFVILAVTIVDVPEIFRWEKNKLGFQNIISIVFGSK